MARRITLIRHAETEANVAGGWQGQSNSELTARGRDQIAALGRRGPDPALLLASDLDRTMATALAFGEPEPDPMWREYDFGAWDGMHPDEIEWRFPGQLAEMRSGGDFAPDGGERLSDFGLRIQTAFANVASRLDDGEEAIVVTHGGVIHGMLSMILGIEDRGALGLSDNTGVTTIVLDGRPQVYTFNDVTHLDGNGPDHDGRGVTLYRHGETVANVEHRWHGQGESPLTETGRRQAAALAEHAAPLDVIASSPLSRARETAESVAVRQGKTVEIVPGLTEMHFGAWEGLTADEVEAADPEAFRRIYHDGNDEARGTTGETYSGAGARFAAAVDEITGRSDMRSFGLFTHGGVSRAYIAGLLGVSFADRHGLAPFRNTAHAGISVGPRRTRLVSYNVAPHLAD